MTRPLRNLIYFDTVSGVLVEFLGITGGSMHFREITGNYSGADYFLHENNWEDYIEISQIKLLEILYGY